MISRNSREIVMLNSQFNDERTKRKVMELSMMTNNDNTSVKLRKEQNAKLINDFDGKLRKSQESLKVDIEDISKCMKNKRLYELQLKNTSIRSQSKSEIERLTEMIPDEDYFPKGFNEARRERLKLNKEKVKKDDSSIDSMALYRNYLKIRNASMKNKENEEMSKSICKSKRTQSNRSSKLKESLKKIEVAKINVI